MEITNQILRKNLAAFFRQRMWLFNYNRSLEKCYDPKSAKTASRFLATLNQQSETKWQELTKLEKDSVYCLMVDLLQSLSPDNFLSPDFVITSTEPEEQAIQVLQQMFGEDHR
ncbi:hypothetical protein FW755_03220 [Lonepinella koalarum]|uniref:hypothetical protein n=1 Tax=Lonepinella koalarum TaxID=53417 RepID=UPI0011E4153C|nr:hypothetical protein [Lonepinella koalarum]TYG34169.1 hypothetical protein FW755_03220 [Lonepinella koalarum]